MTYDADGNLATLPSHPPRASPRRTRSRTSLDLLGIYEPPEGTLKQSTFNTSYTYNADELIQSIAVPNDSGLRQPHLYLRPVRATLRNPRRPEQGRREYTYNGADQVAAIATTSGILTNTYDGFLRPGRVERRGQRLDRLDVRRLLPRPARTVNGSAAADYTYDNDNLFLARPPRRPSTVTRDYTTYYGRVTTTTLGHVKDKWAYDGVRRASHVQGDETAARDPLFDDGRDAQQERSDHGHDRGDQRHDAHVVLQVRRTEPPHERHTRRHHEHVHVRSQRQPHRDERREVHLRRAGPPRQGARRMSFTYTNNGTLLKQKDSEGTRTAAYDLSAVLGSFTLENGDVIDYQNDGLQRRVGRELTWGTPISQQFVYDDQLRVAAELNGSKVTSVFVYGTKPNVPDYMCRDNKAYRIISDHLGSVRLVVTTTEPVKVIQQLDYDEFGNVLSSSFDTTCAATRSASRSSRSASRAGFRTATPGW